MSWLKRLLGWAGESGGEGGAEPADERDEWSDDDFPEVIEMPVEDFIDLHHFPPREIPEVVDSYLEAAVEKGFTELRLIHGRGKGVQRSRVQSLLTRHPLVLSFRDAPVERGGWGATIVLLKKPSPGPRGEA